MKTFNEFLNETIIDDILSDYEDVEDFKTPSVTKKTNKKKKI